MTPAIITTEEMQVLKSKIMELQSALLFTESKSIVKLPTHVISDVELDSDGNIWLVIPQPAMHIEAYEKEIPAKLDFFKKGKDFFVKVRGTAYLQTDLAEAGEMLSEEMCQRMQDESVMAVKVLVQESELVDNSPKPSQNWLQASRSHL